MVGSETTIVDRNWNKQSTISNWRNGPIETFRIDRCNFIPYIFLLILSGNISFNSNTDFAFLLSPFNQFLGSAYNRIELNIKDEIEGYLFICSRERSKEVWTLDFFFQRKQKILPEEGKTLNKKKKEEKKRNNTLFASREIVRFFIFILKLRNQFYWTNSLLVNSLFIACS